MILDPDITPDELKVFIEETDDQIELLDEDIVRLEKESDEPELLQEIFRAAHTIKGSSAMVGHQQMAALTHAMESLLDKLRNGDLSVTTEIIDALLSALDNLKTLKSEITSDEESGLDTGPVISVLANLTEGNTVQQQTPAPSLSPGQAEIEKVESARKSGKNTYSVKVQISRESEWAAIRCLQCLNDLKNQGEVIASSPTAQEIEEEKVGFEMEVLFAGTCDDKAISRVLMLTSEIENVEVSPYSASDQKTGKKTVQKPKSSSSDGDSGAARQDNQSVQSIRVGVDILDNLMNIAEELVIGRSRISQMGKMLEMKYAGDELIQELTRSSDLIIKNINELQENIMQARMIPVGTIFSRFPRMVRDLAKAQGKKLDFHVEGGETELDRSLIDQIRDPLIHLLRNSVDHGVELPEVRKGAGKPETAAVRLSARREQSHIVIDVSDDGKGISSTLIKESAVKKGLITPEAADKLNDTEALNLIFMPGMSTAAKATEVSGRGVGMDIVRANVENLGGSIFLDTRVGKGSTFTVKLPLTVAIIQGFLVSVGSSVFILPMGSIIETAAVDPGEVQIVRKQEVIRWRDNLVPLLRLDKSLGVRSAKKVEHGEKLIVVVLRADDHLVGLVMDELMEPQEIVVKSLGSYLGDIEGIAGATILGDGRIALILDAVSLARRALRKGSKAGGKGEGEATRLSPSSVR